MKQLYEHGCASVSSSLKNETDPYEHGSILASSSLKNETNPSPLEPSLPWNLELEPSFLSLLLLDFISPSPSSEHICTSNHESNWVTKKSRRTNWSLGGISPAYGYHTGVKPLAFVGHARRKLPPLDIMLGRNPRMGIFFSIIYF